MASHKAKISTKNRRARPRTPHKTLLSGDQPSIYQQIISGFIYPPYSCKVPLDYFTACCRIMELLRCERGSARLDNNRTTADGSNCNSDYTGFSAAGAVAVDLEQPTDCVS